ncbi:hypothetical protein [Desulfurococcus mucosus]|uniref:Uncharacterized protein n=1 Tax=Desulfurococcus mucosus (strain ATCC 35584 / DSM 2162 / JCM 9187 / O7/1) TaxID=765177 RepID=E8R7Z2_DESM0|nr:hypothetical protein [Desulfurococcus mucosus]ADV64618.1 hypothetical protein Desmu_0299 [Desulfurococcus mucosus DSM 2162]
MNSHGLTGMALNGSRSGKIKLRVTRDVFNRLNSLLLESLPAIYGYNGLIKGEKYYLKPVHIVSRRLPTGATVKYYYYGRYWYRVERSSDGRIKWIYLGRVKPSPSLPDPPANPLEGLVVKKIEEEGVVELVFANEEVFKRLYSKLFQAT